ncbi:MAG TPA: HisA/HisF-related TIM barrel protein, partial [Gammaproteobacteria bacterium]
MTAARRIIPCFDIVKGRVVKGIRMEAVDDRADPVAVAHAFDAQGADELALLEVSGGGRGDVLADVLARVSERVFIPVTAGGGISDCQDIKRMLTAGADKVMLNTAAVLDPELVLRAVDRFGGESIVGAVDVRRKKGNADSEPVWEVLTHGGRKGTDMDARVWVQQLADYGVGEIILTSMDRDGTRKGFDLPLVESLSAITTVPL